MKNAHSILSKANSNVAVLMQAHEGAVDCFNLPDKCKSIKVGIDSQLHDITITDLKFLETMKYTISIHGGLLYNTDRGSAVSWLGVPDESGTY